MLFGGYSVAAVGGLLLCSVCCDLRLFVNVFTWYLLGVSVYGLCGCVVNACGGCISLLVVVLLALCCLVLLLLRVVVVMCVVVVTGAAVDCLLLLLLLWLLVVVLVCECVSFYWGGCLVCAYVFVCVV